MLSAAAVALATTGFFALVIAGSIRLAFRAWDNCSGSDPGAAGTGEGE